MRLPALFSLVKRHLSSSSEFTRNVLSMLTGNVFGQLITIIASPIITRLYSADDFGKMTYVFSIVGICSVLSCFRYDTAIVLPKDDSKSFGIFLLCLVIALSFSAFLFLITFFEGANISRAMKKPWLTPWLFFVPIGVLLWGTLNPLTFLYTRLKRFTYLSIGRIVVSTSTVATKIVAGLLFGSTTFWLLTGNLVGPLALLVFLGVGLGVKNIRAIFSETSLKRLTEVAKEYRKFPQYSMPTGLINSVSQNIPVILLAQFFSPDTVGLFGLANSVLRKPITVMGQSFSKVYLQKAALLFADGRSLRGSFLKTTGVLAAIGIVPFGILAFSGKSIFSIIFGERWATGGLYAQLLSPWLFLLFINPPATQVVIVKQALRYNLFYNIVTMLMRIGSIVFGYFLLPQPWAVIASYSACGVVVNVFYIVYAFRLTKTSLGE